MAAPLNLFGLLLVTMLVSMAFTANSQPHKLAMARPPRLSSAPAPSPVPTPAPTPLPVQAPPNADTLPFFFDAISRSPPSPMRAFEESPVFLPPHPAPAISDPDEDASPSPSPAFFDIGDPLTVDNSPPPAASAPDVADDEALSTSAPVTAYINEGAALASITSCSFIVTMIVIHMAPLIA